MDTWLLVLTAIAVNVGIGVGVGFWLESVAKRYPTEEEYSCKSEAEAP